MQSRLTGKAPIYGTPVNFAGQTMGTVAGVPAAAFFFQGTNIPNTFTPQFDTALTGVAVTNWSNTGATVYFYLQDLTTGQAAYGYNSGNGIGNNAGAAVSYAPTTYPLYAGHVYQWQGIRGSAGATYCQVIPQYLAPALDVSSLSVYSPFLVTTAQTVAKTGTITTTAPGQGTNQQYYRNGNPTWLYMMDLWVSGSGVMDPYITNLSASNANQFTADNYGYQTLTSTLNRYTYGPFSSSIWPFTAGSTYSLNLYAIQGSLTITQAYINLTVGQ